MAGTDSEARFEGIGQEFHAKYMGSVEVSKSKGQEVCQEAMQKLLTALKTRKEPKPRLIINLSYEGTRLKEMPPGINLLEMTFKHNQVSYVWKDPRDQRSLGIVRTEADPDDASKVVHKFHGIRTVKPAMPFLQEMQELFRIVKERSALQKERAASVSAGADSSGGGGGAKEPAPSSSAANQQAEPQPQQQQQETRDRGASNLLGPDTPQETGGFLPKNESVASLEDLGDIFSSSATIGQQSSANQPFGGSNTGGNPFGQPMGGGGGGGQFGQPMGGGGGGQFGQPMGGGGGGQFGQPMRSGGGQFGQPGGMPINPFGQPMGGASSAFGQPMGGGASAFGQPMGGGASAFGQPMGGAANPFGQPMGGYPAQRSPVPFSQHQQQQQQQYPYYQQQASQPSNSSSSTNPFSSVFDRQNSVPAGGSDDLLMPVSLNPQQAAGKSEPAVKPDAFSDLVVGLSTSGMDPKRQQVSGKDLFKPVDKPKTSLRDLANQSPRPQ